VLLDHLPEVGRRGTPVRELGEKHLLFIVDVRLERLRELPDRRDQRKQLWLSAAVDARDLGGQGNDRRKGAPKVTVMLANDPFEELSGGEKARIAGRARRALASRGLDLAAHDGDLQSSFGAGSFEGLIARAAKIDSMALEHGC